jgi:hypothetical protein
MQPAFWGGLFIGVLSALPFVGDLNLCCCIWVLSGGVLTAYLLQEARPVPITAGDGATGGLVAGAIGAVITSVLSAIISTLRGVNMNAALDQMLSRGDVPPQVGDALSQLRDVPTAVWFLVFFVITLIVYPIFAMLGGLLGVAIFKRTPPPPPPGTVEVLPPVE